MQAAFFVATACVAGGAALRWRGVRVFDVLYWVYTTPLGGVLHRRQLAARANEGKGPHSKCDGDEGFVKLNDDLFVRLVPVLDDNYAYLLVNTSDNEVWAIDAADPDAILGAISEEELRLGHALRFTTVLTTHYHHDHAGGNAALRDRVPNLRVVGGEHERLAGVAARTCTVRDGDTLTLGGTIVRTISTPGHTHGHVCFAIQDLCIFTGDALFQAGAGQHFEGGPAQLHASLQRLNDSLPAHTLVLCGHEYTQDNLAFASWLEPQRSDVQERLQWAKGKREAKLPTVPATIAHERLLNPFLRVPQLFRDSAATRQLLNDAAGRAKLQGSEVSVRFQDEPGLFAVLRALKDTKAYAAAPASS